MAEAGGGTYAAILTDLLDRGVIARDDAILVQFAGAFDEAVKDIDAIAHLAAPYHFNAVDPEGKSLSVAIDVQLD